MDAKTALKKRTMYTKCYDTLSAQNTTPDLRGQFLLATQSAPSGLWRIAKAQLYSEGSADGTSHARYQFTNGQDSREMALLDAMRQLAAFEAAQRIQGAIEHESFTYPNATYYRDMAMINAIVFDEDTGEPTELENGTIPAKDGDYNAAEIALAAHYYAQAFEAALQRSQNPEAVSPLDELLSPYAPQEVDFDVLFKTLNARNSFDEFCDALLEAEEYLPIIAHEKIRRGSDKLVAAKSGKYSVEASGNEVTFIYPQKSLQNALIAAGKAYKTFSKGLTPQMGQFLSDTFQCFKLVSKVLDIKISLLMDLEQNIHISPKDFSSHIQQIVQAHNMSEESTVKLQRACLDIENIEVPKALRDMNKTLQQWRKDIDRLSDRHLQDVALRGQPAADLRPVMFTGTKRNKFW